jgi:hypothetical protein
MIRRQVVAPFLLLLFCTTFGSAGDQSGTTVRDAVRLFRSQNEVGIIRGLADLVALPNIATNFDDMERNAKHLTEMLEDRRFEVQLLRASGGPPAIFGRRLVDGADRTVVFYAHYDGQPVVPELWSSDPFKAMIRTGRVEAGAEEVSFDKIEAPINPDSMRPELRRASTSNCCSTAKKNGARRTWQRSFAGTRTYLPPICGCSATVRCIRRVCRRSSSASAG